MLSKSENSLVLSNISGGPPGTLAYLMGYQSLCKFTEKQNGDPEEEGRTLALVITV